MPGCLVVRFRLAVVTNQLEAADHLADSEEAQQLGEQDAAADELRVRDVPDSAHDGCGLGRGAGRGAGRGLQQGAGVLEGAQCAVEVALEGGHGSVW